LNFRIVNDGHPGTEVSAYELWDELSQDEICKSITDFRKRLRACVNAEGGHFEHLLQRLLEYC